MVLVPKPLKISHGSNEGTISALTWTVCVFVCLTGNILLAEKRVKRSGALCGVNALNSSRAMIVQTTFYVSLRGK